MDFFVLMLVVHLLFGINESFLGTEAKDNPTVSIGSPVYNGTFGVQITLQCTITSDQPVTEIYWERNINESVTRLDDGTPGTGGISISNPSITIYVPTFLDSGLYSCCARNKEGLSKSDSTTLNIFGEVPTVTAKTKTISTVYGMPITLEVSAVGQPEYFEVHWEKVVDGQAKRITVGSVGYKGANTMALIIYFPTFHDGGLYFCYVTNIIGSGKSQGVELIVIGGPPSPAANITEYRSNIGATTTLFCNISSIPRPNLVYWEKYVGGTTHRIFSDTIGISGSTIDFPSLSILSVTLYDSGNYTCFAENLVGIGKSDPIHLKVEGDLPTVRTESSIYTVVYGNNITLVCDVESTPPVLDIYWQKFDNGILVSTITHGAVGTIGITPENPSLTIISAMKSDVGEYVCSAVSSIGLGRSLSTQLFVIGATPTVEILYPIRTIKYGHEQTLDCKISSIPKQTEVYWQHEINGIVRRLDATTSGTKGITIQEPSLTISTVTTSDAGWYKCYAVNAVGTGSSDFSKVTVNGDLPVVKVNIVSYTARNGSPITLQCEVMGNPPAFNIYWEKDFNSTKKIINKGATGTSGITVNNPSIKLQSVVPDDSGTYTCFATNEVGTSASQVVLLTVISVQSNFDKTIGFPVVVMETLVYNAPFGIQITLSCSIYSDLVITEVYWERNRDGVITKVEHGTSGTTGVSISYPSLTILVPGLSDAGLYRCFARNENGVGASEIATLNIYGGIPTVTVKTVTYYAVYGIPFTIDVIAKSEPEAIEIHWEKLTDAIITKIKSGTVGYLGANTTTLTIYFPTFSDNGLYFCYVKNIIGTGKSQGMHLSVSGGIPSVIVYIRVYESNIGENVTLYCEVSCIPKHYSVYWEKKIGEISKRITSNTTGIFGSTVENPSLTISYVTLSDSGYYTCFAENTVGIGSSDNIQLKVIGGLPVVKIVSAMYTTAYGKMVTLFCEVEANPPAQQIFWQKITEGLTSTITHGAVGTEGITPKDPSLTLLFPSKSDAGEYVCSAVNDIGQGSSLSTHLFVIGEVPTVIVKYLDITVDYGEQHTIDCQVTAIPLHTEVFWHHEVDGNIRKIESDTFGIEGVTTLVPSLTISTVTASDSGWYTCFAINIVGTGRSQSQRLIVNADVPHVDVALVSYTAQPGSGVSLHCSVSGSPPPFNIYWEKLTSAGKTIFNKGATGTSGITVATPSLILQSVAEEDTGSYICFATNDVGTSGSRVIQLTVITSDSDDGGSLALEILKVVGAVVGGIAALLTAIFTFRKYLCRCKKNTNDRTETTESQTDNTNNQCNEEFQDE